MSRQSRAGSGRGRPARTRRLPADAPWEALDGRSAAALLGRLAGRPETEECERDDARLGVISAGDGFRHPDGSVLLVVDCFSGAYNAVSLWFLIPPGKRNPEPLRPQWPEGLAGGEPGRLVNAHFDPQHGELGSFSKSRGLGDCGEMASWRYRAGRFVLTDLRRMSFCRGVPPHRWPPLWR
ncbi:MAG: DUF1176 domain-containing protein [Xanthomonadales bacterium]|nr:DUF1176 domain-containing protein [Xanthomonadales bacterium]